LMVKPKGMLMRSREALASTILRAP